MYLPDIELHEAPTLKAAADLKARHTPDVRLLAGGTDLLVDLKAGRFKIAHLVSINRLDELRGVSETDDGLQIGALTTITQLGSSALVRERFTPLLDATSRLAGPQIRNVATVGGNVTCAVPCADLPPILAAMHASVSLWSPAGQRRVPVEDLFQDVRRTILRDDEILTAACVPKPPPGFGAAYARFSLRDGNAIAVASVAASLTIDRDGVVRDARIVLGAVAPIPTRVKIAETALVGQRLDRDALARAADGAMKTARPISDVRGSAEYRRELTGILTRRALATARRRAEETLP